MDHPSTRVTTNTSHTMDSTHLVEGVTSMVETTSEVEVLHQVEAVFMAATITITIQGVVRTQAGVISTVTSVDQAGPSTTEDKAETAVQTTFNKETERVASVDRNLTAVETLGVDLTTMETETTVPTKIEEAVITTIQWTPDEMDTVHSRDISASIQVLTSTQIAAIIRVLRITQEAITAVLLLIWGGLATITATIMEGAISKG